MNTRLTALKNWILLSRQLPLLAGLLALTLSVSVAPAALAQRGSSEGPRERQGQNWLNLTEAQRAQMDSIRQAQRQQIEAIFTPEQRAQLEAARGNRQNRREVFESLNLTEAQKTQLRAVHESTRAQMDAVLTEEQRQQMQQVRQRMQNRQSEGRQRSQAR